MLVVCGHGIDETVKNDIATADRPADHRHYPGWHPDRKGARGEGKEVRAMPERKTVGQLMEECGSKLGAGIQRPEYMDLNRFAVDTRHMIIFDVLTDDSPIGWKGERTRVYLTEEGYQKALERQKDGHIKILSHAKVFQGHLRYDRSDQLR